MNTEFRKAKFAELQADLKSVMLAICDIKTKRSERDPKGFLIAPKFGIRKLRTLILERCQLQALITRF